MIGIVAGKIAEKYHVPTIIMNYDNGVAKGSARGIPGIDVHRAISVCSAPLLGYGGHSAAAGVRCHTAQVPEFAILFENYCRDHTPNDQSSLSIDAEVELDDLSMDNIEQLELLEPYGNKNDRSLFLTCNVWVVGMRMVGKRENYAQFRVTDGVHTVKCIWWDIGDRVLNDGDNVSIVYSPTIDEWNDKRSVQCVVRDAVIV